MLFVGALILEDLLSLSNVFTILTVLVQQSQYCVPLFIAFRLLEDADQVIALIRLVVFGTFQELEIHQQSFDQHLVRLNHLERDTTVQVADNLIFD